MRQIVEVAYGLPGDPNYRKITRSPVSAWKRFFRDFTSSPYAVDLDAASESPIWASYVEALAISDNFILVGRERKEGRYFTISYPPQMPFFFARDWLLGRCIVTLNRGLLVPGVTIPFFRDIVKQGLDVLETVL